jgi:hypothetical protein
MYDAVSCFTPWKDRLKFCGHDMSVEEKAHEKKARLFASFAEQLIQFSADVIACVSSNVREL